MLTFLKASKRTLQQPIFEGLQRRQSLPMLKLLRSTGKAFQRGRFQGIAHVGEAAHQGPRNCG